MKESKPPRRRILEVALVLALGLAPIWLSPTLVTTDGPSHVYNAFVHLELSDDGAMAEAFEVGSLLRPQVASHAALTALGALGLDLDVAERLWLSVIVTASLLAMARWHGRPDLSSLAVLAWIGLGWNLWMGFYDFSLSLAFLAVLLVGCTEQRRPWVHVGMAGLLFTHLFTAAFGCLILGVSRWRNRESVVGLGGLLGWGVLVSAALVRNTSPDSGLRWDTANRWTGWLMSDVVVSLDPLGWIVGGVMTLLMLGALVSMLGESPNRMAWLGMGVWIGSLVAPDWIGSGGYVPERLRIIALLMIVPLGLRALRSYSVGVHRVVGGLALLLLLVQGTRIVEASQEVDQDRRLLEAALVEAEIDSGALVVSGFTDPFRGLHRIYGYHHLPDRVAIDFGLVALDNYEADEEIFPVRRSPGMKGVSVQPSAEGVTVSGEWSGLLYVIHENTTSASATGADAVRRVERPPFAVTVLARSR